MISWIGENRRCIVALLVRFERIGINNPSDINTKAIKKKYRGAAGQIMSSIGRIHLDNGEHDKALKLFSLFVDIAKTEYGKDSANYMMARNDLADALFYLGKSSEAIKISEEVVKDAKRVLGSHHPCTIIFFDNFELHKNN